MIMSEEFLRLTWESLKDKLSAWCKKDFDYLEKESSEKPSKWKGNPVWITMGKGTKSLVCWWEPIHQRQYSVECRSILNDQTLVLQDNSIMFNVNVLMNKGILATFNNKGDAERCAIRAQRYINDLAEST